MPFPCLTNSIKASKDDCAFTHKIIILAKEVTLLPRSFVSPSAGVLKTSSMKFYLRPTVQARYSGLHFNDFRAKLQPAMAENVKSASIMKHYISLPKVQ